MASFPVARPAETIEAISKRTERPKTVSTIKASTQNPTGPFGLLVAVGRLAVGVLCATSR